MDTKNQRQISEYNLARSQANNRDIKAKLSKWERSVKKLKITRKVSEDGGQSAS